VVFTEHQRQGDSPARIRVVSKFEGGDSLAAQTYLEVSPSHGEEYEDLRALVVSTGVHTAEALADFFALFSCH
jgi:hypothetical protein